MYKNDYRRALIMLRGLMPGYSGFARLERRTLMGSIQLTVNGASSASALYAALLGRRNGRWTGLNMGPLGRDSRGQAGLNWSFDPRNLGGMELEQFDLIAILARGNGECTLVMTGWLNGTQQVNWAQVREAACALYVDRKGSANRQPVTELQRRKAPREEASKPEQPVTQPEPEFEPQEQPEPESPTELEGQSAPQPELEIQIESQAQPEAERAVQEQAAAVVEVVEEEPMKQPEATAQPERAALQAQGDELSCCCAQEAPARETEGAAEAPDQIQEEAATESPAMEVAGQMDVQAAEAPELTCCCIAQAELPDESEPAYQPAEGAQLCACGRALTQDDLAGQEALTPLPGDLVVPTVELEEEADYAEVQVSIDPLTGAVTLSEASSREDEGVQAAESLASQPADLDRPAAYEQEEEEQEAGEEDSGEAVAGLLLELDLTLSWPANIEPLRELFMSQASFTPFEAPGYVFVRAPLPGDTGMSFCAVGIKCVEGVPRVVCYALPAQFAVEPPPGLEGYVWRGSGRTGWWVTWQDAATGQMLTEAES